MKLVVDTNRIIAALVKDSYSRRILSSDLFDFHAVALSRKEIGKYEEELLQKTHLSADQFSDLLDALLGRVVFIDDARIQPFMPQARDVMDSVDPNDTPFLAAALAIDADGIWTHDPHFDHQMLVKVIRTNDLVALS